MGRLWSWVEDNVLPKPAVMSSAGIESVWGGRKRAAVRRLGTVQEARKTVADLGDLNRYVAGASDILDGHCRRLEMEDGGTVGDPEDVHHVIPPHHAIGYAIDDGPDGYALETFEFRQARWEILRRRGKILGVAETTVCRMEHYGPIRVV